MTDDELPDRVANFFPEPEPEKPEPFAGQAGVGPRSGQKPTSIQGPRRKSPDFYIGETFGVNGKGSAGGRAMTTRPDVERLPNGKLPSRHDKIARRIIRAAFKRSYSRVEQHVMKARDVVREVEGLADNSHEKQRYVAKTLALHVPQLTRMSRSEARAENRKFLMQMKREKNANYVARHRRELDGVRGIVAALGALR